MAVVAPRHRLFAVVPLLLLALLFGSWSETAVRMARRTGLFFYVGSDFSHYWAMWSATRHDGPSRMYDHRALHLRRRKLVNAYRARRHPHYRVSECGTPYPPLYGVLFAPLTRWTPHHVLAGWLLVQLGLSVWLAWTAALLLPWALRLAGFVLAVASYPVLMSHYAGQFQMFTVLFLSKCFLALRAGRDLSAGLWLGALAMKPHYAILLLGYLLWKRRYRALLGAAASGSFILLASWLTAGTTAMLGYPRLMLGIEACAPADARFIIGWRSLVAWIAPGLTTPAHFRVAAGLGLVTLAAAAWASRGSWSPAGARFPVVFSLLVVATLLFGYHIDGYGSAILLVPLAAVLGGERCTRALALVAAATALVPAAWFLAGTSAAGFASMGSLSGASRLSTVGLVLLFVALLRAASQHRDGPTSSLPQPSRGGPSPDPGLGGREGGG